MATKTGEEKKHRYVPVKAQIMRCPICHHIIGISSLMSHMGKMGCMTRRNYGKRNLS